MKNNNNLKRKHKHLTFDDRLAIQIMLNNVTTFKDIALELGKDPSTISKEIRRHTSTAENSYTLKDSQGNIINETCIKLEKPPYVCNGCSKKRFCRMKRHFYNAKSAQQEYKKLLSEAREGIPLTKESFYEIDTIISEGVKKGQHLYHIFKTNNIKVSLSTIYRHLDKGYLSISPLDLPRKMKFKPRKKENINYVPKRLRTGRTYDDFLKYIKQNNLSQWVEMDLIIGRPGGKVILTLIFTFCNFMIAFLLDSKKAKCVAGTFNELKENFRKNDIPFNDVFPLILTDNGGEFSNVNAIEKDFDGNCETRLFFCRPMKSSDKPHVEKNHTLFRDICPKGTSFDNFTREDVNLIFSHINSVSRKRFNGKTPYEIFEFTYGEKITSLFGIKKIPPKEVIQSPLLLKK